MSCSIHQGMGRERHCVQAIHSAAHSFTCSYLISHGTKQAPPRDIGALQMSVREVPFASAQEHAKFLAECAHRGHSALWASNAEEMASTLQWGSLCLETALLFCHPP